jgi:uncharacterized membrane protein HdeD (DUF308 family)
MNTELLRKIASQKELKTGTGWLIALSILLMILGAIAILTPTFTSVTFTLVLGWVLLISSVVRVVQAFRSRAIRGFWLNLVIGVMYAIAGITILFNPVSGTLTLTAILATLFILEGIFAIIHSFKSSPEGGLSWLIRIDGIVTLILGIFVWNRFPSSAQWLIGLYVGISLLLSSISLLLVSVSARRRLHRPYH